MCAVVGFVVWEESVEGGGLQGERGRQWRVRGGEGGGTGKLGKVELN